MIEARRMKDRAHYWMAMYFRTEQELKRLREQVAIYLRPEPKGPAGPWMFAPCCQTVFRSTSRHDFRRCTCGKSFVDGGADYVRCGWEPDGSPPRPATPEEITNHLAGGATWV